MSTGVSEMVELHVEQTRWPESGLTLDVSLDGSTDWWLAADPPYEVGPGTKPTALPVGFTASAPGHYLAELIVRDAEGDLCPQHALLIGSVAPIDADVYPATLDFGVVAPGVEVTLDLTLRNEGPDVELSDVSTEPAVFSPRTTTAVLVGPMSVRIPVAFVATNADPVEGVLTLTFGDGSTVDVGLSANRTEPLVDSDGDGYSVEEGDCDDADPGRAPGADEVLDGVDQDCDGDIDEDWFDVDMDGFTEDEGDCDDTSAAVWPGVPDLEDGIDNDCDGDVDEDGWPTPRCGP